VRLRILPRFRDKRVRDALREQRLERGELGAFPLADHCGSLPQLIADGHVHPPNRTVNMDIGALRQVLKRFKQWRRLEDDVKMLTESGGEPIGRVLTNEEQERLLKTAENNPEWEHV